MNLTEFIEGRREQHLKELCEFLRIPSVSAKSEHKSDVEKGARWVAEHLRAAGLCRIAGSARQTDRFVLRTLRRAARGTAGVVDYACV
jgi:acetylornithine deacetylase/succinyl-diaminopimelate desuccinylase-like protein